MISPQPTPAQLSFRMPAEWEPHAATWLAWPHNQDTWPDPCSVITAVYVEMIAALHRDERVHICVNDPTTARRVRHTLGAAGVDLARVSIYEIPTNDAWTRDHGPIFLTRRYEQTIELGLTNWRFNAWGTKYPPWDLDDRVPERIAQGLDLIPFTPDIVLEGGSIEVNGRGMLLTTESCLLNPNRNPTLTRSDIEHSLRAFLGVQHISWLGEGIAGDDTDGHVDDIARFVNPTTVVCAVEDDPADANYKPLQDNLHRLQSMRDQSGQALRVVPLPMPGPVEQAAERLPASYVNFYIANRTVLVPSYGQPQDHTALSILQELFPGRRLRGIPCRELVVGLGALHCVTMQQPAYDRSYRPA